MYIVAKCMNLKSYCFAWFKYSVLFFRLVRTKYVFHFGGSVKNLE